MQILMWKRCVEYNAYLMFVRVVHYIYKYMHIHTMDVLLVVHLRACYTAARVDCHCVTRRSQRQRKSIQKLLRNLKDKQQNGNGRNSNSNASRRNASFLKPFRSVHGKAAGHVSSRNISSTRLKRDLRYIAVFNPNNKRFKPRQPDATRIGARKNGHC